MVEITFCKRRKLTLMPDSKCENEDTSPERPAEPAERRIRSADPDDEPTG